MGLPTQWQWGWKERINTGDGLEEDSGKAVTIFWFQPTLVNAMESGHRLKSLSLERGMPLPGRKFQKPLPHQQAPL